jgi:hypothetical protein
VNVSVWLGAVGGCRSNGLIAGGEARADQFSYNLHSVIMAALRKIIELVAARGVRDTVSVNSVAASTRPAIANGGKSAHPRADAARPRKRFTD